MWYVNYVASLSGSIGRTHFWILLFVAASLIMVAATVGSLNVGNEPIQLVAYAILIFSCVPVASAVIRRLHDIGFVGRRAWIVIFATCLLQCAAFILAKWSPLIATITCVISTGSLVVLGFVPGKPIDNLV